MDRADPRYLKSRGRGEEVILVVRLVDTEGVYDTPVMMVRGSVQNG